MQNIIFQEEFDKLINLKGKVRGISVRSYGEYILKNEGRQALEELEKTITDCGHSIEYLKLGNLDFYPLGLEAVTVLAIEHLFGYGDEEMRKVGQFQAKSSIIMKLFMRYFFSVERVIKEVPKMWNKYYTVGRLEVEEYNPEERHLILRLFDFYMTPLQCSDLRGYFPTVLQMVIGSEITCEERKCMYRGDDYHEFFMEW